MVTPVKQQVKIKLYLLQLKEFHFLKVIDSGQKKCSKYRFFLIHRQQFIENQKFQFRL